MTKTTTTKLQTVNRKLSAAAVEIGQARPGQARTWGWDWPRRGEVEPKNLLSIWGKSHVMPMHTHSHTCTQTNRCICELEIRKTFNEARAKRLKLVFCYLALIIGSTSNNNSNNKQQKQVIPVRVSICNKDWCRCADANSDATWVEAAAVEIGKSWRDP